MGAQKESIALDFINALSLGEHKGFRGWYFYDRDPIDVVRVELEG